MTDSDYDLEEPVFEFVLRKMNNRSARLYMRSYRRDRKVCNTMWNYFGTLTYSDEKTTEEAFYKEGKRSMNYMHYHHKWLYILRFERGEDNNRLHAHFIAYIPDKDFENKLVEREHWSEKEHRRVKYKAYRYFDQYGESEFVKLEAKNDVTACANYFFQYINKAKESNNITGKLIYSRGINIQSVLELKSEDIAGSFTIINKRKIIRCIVDPSAVVRTLTGY